MNYQKYKHNSSTQRLDEHCEEEDYSDLKPISIPASPHHTGRDRRTQMSAQIHIAATTIHSVHIISLNQQINTIQTRNLVPVVEFAAVENQLGLLQWIDGELQNKASTNGKRNIMVRC